MRYGVPGPDISALPEAKRCSECVLDQEDVEERVDQLHVAAVPPLAKLALTKTGNCPHERRDP
jgi:hypothetical protein